ncbi:MAG: glycosyltransferase [Candidatus Micrarchaeia archaeon]
MKIALVGHDFDFSSKDGISRYSYELFTRLKKHNKVSAYEHKKGVGFVGNIVPGLHRYTVGIKVDDADIVHLMYPNTTYVRSSAPQALTWHDASIFNRYKTFNIFSSDMYHWLGVALPALRNTNRANGITYNSEETRKSLIPYIGKYLDKPNEVITHGIDDAFIKSKIDHNIERKDFVYVGSVQYPHKNIPLLIKSFESANTGNNMLYIFTPTDRDLIDPSYFKAKKVKIIIKASTSEVIEKLKHSIALLHFSRLEGFGVPILESMALGTPVVVLKSAEIPKIVTKYAIKISESEIKSTIGKLALTKPELSDEAIEYAKSFSWDRTVSMTVEFYKKILEMQSKS